MYIVADFSKLSSITQYQEIIGDKLKGIDIGVLILNAGITTPGPLDKIDKEWVETTVSVNAL